MALNPAFASSTTRKLPFACGYVKGQGDPFLTATLLNGSQAALYLLGEGEWDGFEMANTFANPGNGTTIQAVPSHLIRQSLTMNSPTFFEDAYNGAIIHFHSGKYTPIGTVIPTVDPATALIPKNASQDVGPEQGYDPRFTAFPTVTPPQSFSGIAYAVWATATPPFPWNRGTWVPNQLSGTCIWRTTRCRIFDAYGNVIGYQFTCNPAWHKVEAILRFKIKPQQPPCAGLTDAERACFNWESIVQLAARNDYILPNGNPRFTGSYIFASDASLTNMLETMCRLDRSFIREDGGQIHMIGDDARSSVFIASAKHLVPGTLKLNKKDVSKAPNLFVPRYRDLDIPAVCQIQSAISYGAFTLSGRVIKGFRAFTCSTPSPFTSFSYMTVGGATYRGTPKPDWDGDYQTFVPDESGDPYPKGSLHPDVTYAAMNTPAGTPLDYLDGGYIGTNDARFNERTPTGVQHRSAQRMQPMQAPGLAVQATVRRVEYDCGNSTFDQTNRLMKFERDSQLGTDTGAGWRAPIAGTLSLYFESVDINGAQLPVWAKVRHVITFDDWLFPEAPGDYQIMDLSIIAPTESSLGQIDLTLQEYNRDAYTDVSDDPGNQYLAVPGSGLKLTGFTLPAGDSGAYAMRATLKVTHVGSTLTITASDLVTVAWSRRHRRLSRLLRCRRSDRSGSVPTRAGFRQEWRRADVRFCGWNEDDQRG